MIVHCCCCCRHRRRCCRRRRRCCCRYGAYGSKKWPSFDPADISLLDKGLLLAVAHVRGGGELGGAWHTHGQRFSKVGLRDRGCGFRGQAFRSHCS